MYAPNTYWTLGSAKWRCIYADEVYLHLLPLFNLMEDNGTVFNLFLLLFPSFSSTDEKERAWLTSRCNFSFRPGLEPKKSRQFKLDWFCCTFLLSQWMVRGIMYFDFGAKMLGKMLTEENDTSLTSFFFLFCLKMHLLRHTHVVALDTHFNFFFWKFTSFWELGSGWNLIR